MAIQTWDGTVWCSRHPRTEVTHHACPYCYRYTVGRYGNANPARVWELRRRDVIERLRDWVCDADGSDEFRRRNAIAERRIIRIQEMRWPGESR